MHKYRLISKKGEGTFSEVLKAQVRGWFGRGNFRVLAGACITISNYS